MSGYAIAITIMFAISFIDRVHSIFAGKPDNGSTQVIALALTMCWYGAIVMLLHAGGFQ